MADMYPPIHPKVSQFLHGGDYNPDQWPAEVWAEDVRLMKLAGCNAMTVAIFSWVHLEPAEGRFTFDWLDRVMDMLADSKAFALLATPSAAHPAWMSAKYPEVLRTGSDGRRRCHGGRVNYCLTSPVFREKCALIADRLADRYKDHPALIAWHPSNEYGGECHCELCQAAFREWLRRRYGTLDALNTAWWAAFWGHTYTDFSQIASPHDRGERSMQGLHLDWRRFVTDQTVSFLLNECAPLRLRAPAVPVIANLMGTYPGLDYWKLAPHVDRISWDAYPAYHDRDDDWRQAARFSFLHDLNRTLKGGLPFLMMESTPSSCNWMGVMKLKRPGVHRLASLQAVAHGADSVQYFQWRKSRGASEKLHGAVVDHCGHEHTRVFAEVAEVGRDLERLAPVLGTTVRPQVAIVYDWENRWAIDVCAGPRRDGRDYEPTCANHYRQFWSRAVPVDVINADCDLSAYRLVIAPMLYMVRPGFAERVERFVAGGGVFVTTYWSGIVNESDLCFTGGFPGPLRKVLGLWSEELDVLYDDESNRVVMARPNALGLEGEYRAGVFCDLIHAETAEVLATYGRDFYAGRPALTVNAFGSGRAYYIASRNDDAFLSGFYGRLIEQMGLGRVIEADLPEGVTAQTRTDGRRHYVFLLNFRRDEAEVDLGEAEFLDALTRQAVKHSVRLDGYGVRVLERVARM